jgi:hypothetical protein
MKKDSKYGNSKIHKIVYLDNINRVINPYFYDNKYNGEVKIPVNFLESIIC